MLKTEMQWTKYTHEDVLLKCTQSFEILHLHKEIQSNFQVWLSLQETSMLAGLPHKI